MKIYAANVYMGDGVIAYGADVVLHSAHLNELAALREELAKQVARTNDYCSKLTGTEQRLTAAEQRNASHESMLRHFASCADVRQVGTSAMDYVATLQPTESGASE